MRNEHVVDGTHANGSEYKSFWFHWGNGDIRGGSGNTVGSQTFIELKDLNAFYVRGLGIATCWGATGSWKIKVDGKQFNSHIIFRPLHGSLLQCLDNRQDMILSCFPPIFFILSIHVTSGCYLKINDFERSY